jgi:hypothetical protein
MSDLIDRVSAYDDAEQKRKQRVAAHNNFIIASLGTALDERRARYNRSHPQDRYAPEALTQSTARESSTEFSIEVAENTEPRSSLRLEFPINSGGMVFHRPSTSSESRTILVDYKDDAAVFYVGKDVYSNDSFADWLLSFVLFPEQSLPPTPEVRNSLASGNQTASTLTA